MGLENIMREYAQTCIKSSLQVAMKQIMILSTSEIKISVLVDSEVANTAVKAIHKKFLE